MAAEKSTRYCEIVGCSNQMRARGMCATHWSRWKRHGDPSLGALHRLSGVCSVEWCNNKTRARFKKEGAEYCAVHYLQVLKNGAVGKQPKTPIEGRCCSVEACRRPARSRTSEHCDTHYYRLRRSGSLAATVQMGGWSSCQYCAAPTSGPKFCSPRCQSRDQRNVSRFGCCTVCDKRFEPINGAEFCSPECRRIQRQQYSDIRRMVSSLTGDGRRARYAVFKRDNWVCQICGEPTDRAVKWPHPMYPTIDHIIPVSKGGRHEVENLQCAHARCNVRKQATMPSGIGFQLAA